MEDVYAGITIIIDPPDEESEELKTQDLPPDVLNNNINAINEKAAENEHSDISVVIHPPQEEDNQPDQRKSDNLADIDRDVDKDKRHTSPIPSRRNQSEVCPYVSHSQNHVTF